MQKTGVISIDKDYWSYYLVSEFKSVRRITMSFQMFHDICQEIALQETRSIALPSNSGYDLPADDYGFLEMYCSEVG